MSIRINQHTFQTQPQPTVPKQTEKFEETLTSTELKVSNHARKRLEQRGYALEQQDMTTLNTAVNELEEKGSEQSLLLYKDLALIASVRNRTIITALNPDELDFDFCPYGAFACDSLDHPEQNEKKRVDPLLYILSLGYTNITLNYINNFCI